MDFQYYINLLLRRKWAILLTTLLAAVLAYVLASRLPSKYYTEATLETGVLNYDGGSANTGFVQKFQIEGRFDNLIKEFRSRKMLKFEAFRLLVHDLDTDDAVIPFRQPKENIENVSPEEIHELITVLKQKIKDNETTLDKKSSETFRTLAKAYGYDYESLLKPLRVGRIQKTDYLKVGTEALNPVYAAFLANNLSEDYIAMSSEDKFASQNEIIGNYSDLLKEKKHLLDSLTRLQNKYMTQTATVDASQESKVMVNNLIDMQNKLAEASKEVAATKSAIAKVKTQLRNLKSQSGSSGNDAATQRLVTDMKRDIKRMQGDYIGGGQKDKELLAEISRKSHQLELLLADVKYTGGGGNDNRREEELEKKKLNLELKLGDAEASQSQYASAVTRLRNQIPSMVSHDTYLTKIDAEITHVKDQYEGVSNRLGEAKAGRTNQKIPLKIYEYAPVPETQQSKKAPFVAAFAGVGAGVLSTILIFLLAFFDNKLTNANQFKQLVKLPLLGKLPFVKGGVNSSSLFAGENEKLSSFKELLRSIRYRIEEVQEDVFLVTSLKQDDGKSFVIKSLVAALAANGKKVLVIDTNFRKNSLSNDVPKGTMNFGVLVDKLITEYDLGNVFKTTTNQSTGEITQYDLIQNTGKRMGSPMEVLAGKDFSGFLEELIGLYDIVLIEGAAIAEFSDSKELEQYADRVIGVFAANASLDANDRDAIAHLRTLNEKYLGSILNGVDPKNLN